MSYEETRGADKFGVCNLLTIPVAVEKVQMPFHCGNYGSLISSSRRGIKALELVWRKEYLFHWRREECQAPTREFTIPRASKLLSQGHPEMPRRRYQTFERKGFLLPAGGTCSNKEFESTLKVESCLGRLTELNSCKHKCQGRLYENSRTTWGTSNDFLKEREVKVIKKGRAKRSTS